MEPQTDRFILAEDEVEVKFASSSAVSFNPGTINEIA